MFFSSRCFVVVVVVVDVVVKFFLSLLVVVVVVSFLCLVYSPFQGSWDAGGYQEEEEGQENQGQGQSEFQTFFWEGWGEIFFL